MCEYTHCAIHDEILAEIVQHPDGITTLELVDAFNGGYTERKLEPRISELFTNDVIAQVEPPEVIAGRHWFVPDISKLRPACRRCMEGERTHLSGGRHYHKIPGSKTPCLAKNWKRD